MNRSDLHSLDPSRTYWALAVVSPQRNWSGAPGCRRGARFLVDGRFRANALDFQTFDSQLECLSWIMAHRTELNHNVPSVRPRPVQLDRWLLGLE
jgi:hypothetical protein